MHDRVGAFEHRRVSAGSRVPRATLTTGRQDAAGIFDIARQRHHCVSVAEQAAHQMGADKPGCSGDQDAHGPHPNPA
jgi:hypothetical protein